MARRYQRNGALLQRFFARVTIETLTETGNRARQTSGTQGTSGLKVFQTRVISNYLSCVADVKRKGKWEGRGEEKRGGCPFSRLPPPPHPVFPPTFPSLLTPSTQATSYWTFTLFEDRARQSFLSVENIVIL